MAKTMTKVERHAAYKRQIKRFARKMLFELVMNDKQKGNFLDWHPTGPHAMSELEHHVVKLGTAIRDGNLTQIMEYSADIGNIVMAIEKSPRIIQRKSTCPPYSRRSKP